MNTSDIEVFLCAADALSFSKAAEEKYMSRQAVSRKVGALEKELGVSLFRRSQRGQRLVLTPEGQRYYDFFRVSQRRWEELRASIHTDLGGSLIHVAYLEGLDFLPSLQQILRDVQDKYGRGQYFGTAGEEGKQEPARSRSEDSGSQKAVRGSFADKKKEECGRKQRE